jgi:uncharacterized protein (TIGR02466 family)
MKSLIQNIFVSTIFKKNLNDKIYKNYFLKKLKSCKKSVVVSNVGGFQSESLIEVETNILHHIFLNPAYEFAKELNPRQEINLKLLNYWLNLNKTNNYNEFHNHQGFLSGIYYIKTPKNSGRLVFQEGNLTKMSTNYYKYFDNPNFYTKFTVNPQEGDLYLFTSNTLHYVEPNLSKKDRISVAFNLGVQTYSKGD